MTIRLFQVGGSVRDSLLGLQSKDIDIAVEANSWEEMREFVVANTKKVFLEKPEFFTIRALDADNVPKDFVLCRKDGVYSDGRRPDSVEIGTIFDDISRRDFTMNAIAIDLQTGELLDPHDGQSDLKFKFIRCVGKTEERFSEDPLRILRAIRFAITKRLMISSEIHQVLLDEKFWPPLLSTVSRERVREEVLKCFKFDSLSAIKFFGQHCSLGMLSAIFEEDLWLEATLKEK